MALAYPENLGSLTNGDLVFQDVVKRLESRQFSLFQCHILHGWTAMIGLRHLGRV